MWAAFRTATRHRLVRHAVGTGVVVISIVERSGVAARERASPGASLELVEAELPAVRHHCHTFPTKVVHPSGPREHVRIDQRTAAPSGTLDAQSDRASGSRRVLAGLPQPSGLEIGHVPRERSPGQRRPRCRIAKPAGANRAAATAPLKPLPTTTAWKSPSRATPARRLRVCEVKAKGQQADLVLLEAYLNCWRLCLLC